MELFGYSLQTLYVIGLIVGGCGTLIYVLLSDVLEGIFEFISDGIFNLTLVLSFVTICSASGYLLESFTNVNSFIIFIVSALVALLLVSLLHIFILVPLASAEATLAYSDEDLKGRMGQVITSIPVSGFGEVLIRAYSGNIAKSATSFENVAIPAGKEILIIDVQDGVVQVSEHDRLT